LTGGACCFIIDNGYQYRYGGWRIMYICLCRGITESAIKRLGEEGVVCPHALACELGLNEPDCCGRCLKKIEALTAIAQQHTRSPAG